MKLSIIIPTYCRLIDLCKTLDCIENQSYKNFEVIIIDASPINFQLTKKKIDSYNLNINYIRYGIAGNVSKQRNIGLRVSTGDVLLFLDDDVTFNTDLFQNYVDLFINNKYDAISGLVETNKYKMGSEPIKISSQILNNIGLLNYQPCNFIIETPVICTANFAFKRYLFEIFGGFDENILGSLDDVDYGIYLTNNGVKIIHHPLVQVFHHQTLMTGARSNNLPPWWSYYNQCYFQMKNRKINHKVLLCKASWQLLKPSRSWLKINTLIKRYKAFINGFIRARKIVSQIQ